MDKNLGGPDEYILTKKQISTVEKTLSVFNVSLPRDFSRISYGFLTYIKAAKAAEFSLFCKLYRPFYLWLKEFIGM